jgi:site-specific recombinase XerD
MKNINAFNRPLAVKEVKTYAQDWLIDGELRNLAPNTIRNRRDMLKSFLQFLEKQEFGEVDTRVISLYLHSIPNATTRALRYRQLKTFFKSLVENGYIERSLMEKVPAPLARQSQIQPFLPEHVQKLFKACEKTRNPVRNLAILTVLLDTGLRVSELCALRGKHLNWEGRQLIVAHGKGGKSRAVPFGLETKKALWRYFRHEYGGLPEGEDPVFVSERGNALTSIGVGMLFRLLERQTGIQDVRVSPHTCRHTFAVSFLRGGGNVFSLQQILGHTSLSMTNRYVALAQADLHNQHAAASPLAVATGRKKS